MTRVEFTKRLAEFILDMFAEGEKPVINEVKRETIQQVYYYLTKLSKCDGINNRSKHQDGRAVDIFFVDDKGNYDWSEERYEKWHKIWQEKYGGDPAISRDLVHFQSS
jgi:hypothetical protein